MKQVTIKAVKNGWLVFDENPDLRPQIQHTPLVFTDFSKMTDYIEKILHPEFKGVE